MKRVCQMFFAALAVITQATPVQAQECKISKLSEFGRVELGETRANLPKDLKALPCPETNMFCEFVDEQGVHYLVDEIGVAEKFILVTKQTPASWLPFGLTPQDTPEDVRRKIGARADAPELSRSQYDSGLYASSCITQVPTDTDGFRLEFDFGQDGKLSKIKVADSWS